MHCTSASSSAKRAARQFVCKLLSHFRTANPCPVQLPSLTHLLLGLSLAGILVVPETNAQDQPSENHPSRRGASPESTATEGQANLIGLWEAKRRFGPDLAGALLIRESDETWTAEICGQTAVVEREDGKVSFKFPETGNSFKGALSADNGSITGHWMQPDGLGYASPVTLTRSEAGIWSGVVVPYERTLTFYLKVDLASDGGLAAFLRNPELNLGLWKYPVASIEQNGIAVKLLSATEGDEGARTLAEGRYDPKRNVLTVDLEEGSFDFKRIVEGEFTNFYPRGRRTVPYRYNPPPAQSDGWPTASLDSVGISVAKMESFIQMVIDAPMDSVNAPDVHGVLIARNGGLVLEEYFHGEHRDKPHDTRSAAKSLTSTLIGSAIQAGIPISPETRVYKVMHGGTFPSDLDERKRKLTLEHLMTLSSGLDCDDRDPDSPGNEDFMLGESGPKDYYEFTLALNMVREPGEKQVYCTSSVHLAGGVLAKVADRSLPELFQELFAGPLQIQKYHLPLTPTGVVYMGGAARFLPRDFLKLAQLHVNRGKWDSKAVLSEEWCRRATTPYEPTGGPSNAKYGYLWWVFDYPYQGRVVRAFYASGNGGQYAIGIPELDLVIGVYGGNYGGALPVHTDYVPNWILPAVEDQPTG